MYASCGLYNFLLDTLGAIASWDVCRKGYSGNGDAVKHPLKDKHITFMRKQFLKVGLGRCL